MSNKIVPVLAAMMWWVVSISSMAATINFTATYSPSSANPENSRFTNTTPRSGYCSWLPHYCSEEQSSVLLADISLSGNGVLNADESHPRSNFHLDLPASTTVNVVNAETGAQSTVILNVTQFSGLWTGLEGGAQSGWGDGTFAHPSSGSQCSRGATARGSGNGAGNSWYGWVWNTHGGSCYKINTRESRDISSSTLYELSLGYKLTMPSPLLLESGEYTGSVVWSVGPNGDIDFGDMWSPSDNQLTLNFTLSVNHELKVTAKADDLQVSLQPCVAGKTCTEEEGADNWERWRMTRQTPELSGRSQFNLSSSGAFSVYLQCEQQNGSDCMLQSDNSPSQTVPVQALLTLPSNIVDKSTGATVIKRRLAAGRDPAKNSFSTKSFGQNRTGSIDFLVSKKDVDTMLKTRPDTYRGAVTVIFDPNIY